MSGSKSSKKGDAATPGDKTAATKPAAQNKGALVIKQGLPTPVWACICVAFLVCGLLVGRFLLGDTGTVSLQGKTELSESELDSTVATYTYNGATTKVSARDVHEGTSGLTAAANDDGTYAVPTPSYVVSYAQNQIILNEASAQGITATDDEVSSYASANYGSTDYESLGSSLGLDADTVKARLTEEVVMSKLYDSVVTVDAGTAPTAPTEPEDGQEDVPTADYASYVISLLGDEWDSENNTWARTDGTYYATLSGYEISNDSATYAAASAAYQVAYSEYQDLAEQASTQWNSYVSAILSNATIQIGTLV